MKLNFWPFGQPKPAIVASPSAREALGITDPHTQGFAAVALALDQGDTLADPEPEPDKTAVSEVVERHNRLAHLKKHAPTSEYHLALADGVLADLVKDEKRIEFDLTEHERIAADTSARLRSELADTRKAMKFWRTAPDHLAPDAPAPTVKPKRIAPPKKAPSEPPPA